MNTELRKITNAIAASCNSKCVGLLQYIHDAWNWEYDRDTMELEVNLQIHRSVLTMLNFRKFEGAKIVDGCCDGEYEIILVVFKLIRPFPLLSE